VGNNRPGDNRPLILFDGVCNLCNSTVQWVIERDKEERFHFATLQSVSARRELERVMDPEEIDSLPDSIVFLDSKGVHTRSTAALRIAQGLGPPYALLGVGLVVPRLIRDALYDLIARHRYRWFGRRDTCMTPTPDLAGRFLDAGLLPPPTDSQEADSEGTSS
jgi:predicted DCC family thiol-disulfide oxidoreductase YuxK